MPVLIVCSEPALGMTLVQIFLCKCTLASVKKNFWDNLMRFCKIQEVWLRQVWFETYDDNAINCAAKLAAEIPVGSNEAVWKYSVENSWFIYVEILHFDIKIHGYVCVDQFTPFLTWFAKH